ncbi:hypothetical protein [Desulfoluna sp.]|uniref:hypothetical protein n=1 Tax=Desulfoluna sp. TaxID=2045199 RepID=UPI002610D0CA|nr:hypothetical protein [Desulfoluna sp.]
MTISRFDELTKCVGIKSIKDINDQYDYKDEKPKGDGDSPVVACGQNDSYNELQNIYDNKLASFVSSQRITEKEAIHALCEACRELKNPRGRDDFYKYLSKKLSISI